MTPIERVARELCKADGHDPDGPTSDVHIEGEPFAAYPWAGYIGRARIAIAAMREPTPEMMKAMNPMSGAHHVIGDPHRVWQAAIDAALNETP